MKTIDSIKYPRSITYVLRFADGDRVELGRSQARRMLRKAMAKSGCGYVCAKQEGARTVHLNAGSNPSHSPLYLDMFVGRPQTALPQPTTERQHARRETLGAL